MKKIITLALLCSVIGVYAQEAAPPPATLAPEAPSEVIIEDAAAPAPNPEVLDPAYLSEVVRHLYRWYMDEADVEQSEGVEDFPFWVRMLDKELDEGDSSQFAEIVLPLVGISAKVKKTDYIIEELGTEAKSDTFRILSVGRISIPEEMPEDFTVVDLNYKKMKKYLFETRSQARFPDQAMIDYLRPALRAHMGVNPNGREAGEQIIFMAPLSPVANELYVFWETQKMLFRFASDMDLENPDMWENQTLRIRTFDIEKQTVVATHEAPGSNEFLTRDQVGRALFNCIILGQKMSVNNPPAAAAPAPAVVE